MGRHGSHRSHQTHIDAERRTENKERRNRHNSRYFEEAQAGPVNRSVPIKDQPIPPVPRQQIAMIKREPLRIKCCYPEQRTVVKGPHQLSKWARKQLPQGPVEPTWIREGYVVATVIRRLGWKPPRVATATS